MRRAAHTLLGLMALSAMALALPVAAHSADARLVSIGSFSSPVFVTGPPGDRSRVFVVEKTGRIRVVHDGVVNAQPFLDLSSAISTDSERGLLSMAFAPDYPRTRRFYVFFTRAGSGDLVVEELFASSPDEADTATRREILSISHSRFSNHNGGQLQFGPDGYLYIGTGDGGGGNDPDNNAQTLTSRLGKLLRIDPSGTRPGEYAIPSDNPFAGGTSGAREEIWAYGLRNPWRFSFDRETGDLVIGDVGQGRWEEIDFATNASGLGRGANYGWRCREGLIATPGITCDPPMPPGSVDPVFAYPHATGGPCSITGGYVVRDSALPTLAGRYLYGDLCVGQLRTISLPAADDDRAVTLAGTTTTVSSLSSFGEDAAGCVYAVSLSGPVYRLEPEDGSDPCPEPPPPPDPPDEDPPSDPPPPVARPQAPPPPPPPANPIAAAPIAPLPEPVLDRQPARLRIAASSRQRATGRRLTLVATCDERCRLRTRTRIEVADADRPLQPARTVTDLRPNSRRTIRIRLSRSIARVVDRALDDDQRPLATISLTARDLAGNLTRKTARIRIVA